MTQYKVEDKASDKNNVEEQRKRRKKKKSKSKRQEQGANGSEDDSREIALNGTMSSMRTNGDDTELDLKDPDSLSKSKARRVRRKRLKQRNTNGEEGGMNDSHSLTALDNVSADDDCAGDKPNGVGPEPAVPSGQVAPANTVTMESRTDAIVSDDKNQLVEQNIQGTAIKNVDCTNVGLNSDSSVQIQIQPTPVEILPVDNTVVESSSILPDVAPRVGDNEDVLDDLESLIEDADNAPMVMGEMASPVVDDEGIMYTSKEVTDENMKTSEAQTSPSSPEWQSPTVDEGLVSLNTKASSQSSQEEEKLKTPEVSSDSPVATMKEVPVDQSKVRGTPFQLTHENQTVAITLKSSDVQGGVPVTSQVTVDQSKTESQSQPSDLPPLVVPDETSQPHCQQVHRDDKVTPDVESGTQPSNEGPSASSPPLNNAAINSKTIASTAYTDEETKADKENCECTACNIL